MQELSIIQKTYDLIKYYIPILNNLPRNHKFTLGDRLISRLYNLLENLILAKYARNKRNHLEPINSELNILRYQTRLLLDFELINIQRYEYINKLMDEIGKELGGWIKAT